MANGLVDDSDGRPDTSLPASLRRGGRKEAGKKIWQHTATDRWLVGHGQSMRLKWATIMNKMGKYHGWPKNRRH